jgi:hypothetical protein
MPCPTYSSDLQIAKLFSDRRTTFCGPFTFYGRTEGVHNIVIERAFITINLKKGTSSPIEFKYD